MAGSSAQYAASELSAGLEAGADAASDADAVLGRLSETSSLVESIEPGHGKPAESDHDETVENYMSALLKRYGVNSSDPAEPRSASAASSTVNTATPTSNKPAAAHELPPSSTGEAMEYAAAPNRQPVAPPEKRSGLNAMRELAMMSAQGALETHSCKRLVQLMYGKLVLIAVAMISSTALAAMTSAVGGWTYTGAVAMLLLATFWTWQYFASARKLWQKSAAVNVSAEGPVPYGDADSADPSQYVA